MAVSLGLLKYKLVYAARESVAKQRRMFSFDFLTHVVTHVIHFYFKYKAMISCKSKRKAQIERKWESSGYTVLRGG